MDLTIGLAQCRRPENGNVIDNVGRFARQASEEGVRLLVFPEALMTRFDGSPERFAAEAQPVTGPFARAIDDIARREKLWIAYTMNEASGSAPAAANGSCRAGAADAAGNPGTCAPPFNTAIITDDKGRQRARYRKVHLFDAQGERESDRMSAGDRLMPPVVAPFASIGMGICYDLRFPEVTLNAALAGASVMLFPAAWVDGPGKVMQWKTLLAARAIENGLFVAGVSSCDDGRTGHSCVFAPDGTLIVEGGSTEQLVTCTVDLSEVERTRSATPSLQHRRPECYCR